MTKAASSTSEGNPLRVRLVAEGGIWGGIETHLQNLLEALSDAEVDLKLWLLEEGEVADRLGRSSAVEIERIPPGSLLVRRSWLRRRLRSEAVDVVHAHGMAPEVLCGVALWPRRRPALVATVHSDPGRFPSPTPGRSFPVSLAAWLTRRFCASRIIGVTEDVAGILAASGLDGDRVSVIPNGVSSPSPTEIQARGGLRTELGADDRTFVIGTVGRLEAIKGHHRLIDAVEELADASRPVHAWIVGDGPLRNELERDAAARDLQDRIRFLGFRSDSGCVMSSLDAGILCSDHEGMPYAALELMVRGVPLVARAVGGLREVVDPERSGILVDPSEPHGLSRALRRLIDDSKLRKRLAEGGARRVRSDYGMEKVVDRTAEVWRNASRERR